MDVKGETERREGGDMRLLLLLGLDLPFARFHQRFIVQLVLCVCVWVWMER